MTTTHTHSPIYSTAFGSYSCTDCFEDMTYDEAIAANPDIN